MGSTTRGIDEGEHGSLIPELTDPAKFAEIQKRLVFLAWYKYRIQTADAHDVVQSAVTAWCEVRERYAGEAAPLAIFHGIFKKKCLEFLEKSKRDELVLTRLGDAAGAGSEAAVPATLDELIRREEGRLILRALAELPSESRELLKLVADENVGRQGLLDLSSTNKNTLDSRIHAARRKFRELLRARGIIGGSVRRNTHSA